MAGRPRAVYGGRVTTAQTAPHAGLLIREWRLRRSLSQMELASGAAVSARHLSFIETGRARPSREMLMHLAQRLDIPLRGRNRLLLAAGYAPAYGERPLDSEEMGAVTRALETFLSAHEPYPALVVNRRWDMIHANAAVAVLADGVASHLMEPPANALRATLHPEGMAPRILDLPEWSGHVIDRLEHDIGRTGDPDLAALRDELLTYPGVARRSAGVAHRPEDGILLPLRLRHPSGTLSFFATQTVFGTPTDVTLAELSIEAFYPADAATAEFLQRAAA
jgi:transcriptional regulator with XRE-family HTH domain